MEERRKVLEIKNLSKFFPVKSMLRTTGVVKAVDDVSLTIYEGETYGLVGESGCGKSTLGRCILRLIEPTSGQVLFEDKDFLALKGSELRSMRRHIQMVFQDPYMSLDPKKRVGQTLMEALKIHGMGNREERFEKAMSLMEHMGFQMEHFFRYPYQFSGGQRQRIGIARALILNPELIVCDEPVSALDVSVQAQIINLMKDIQDETKVAYLFITHNLSVVRYISNRVGVMYLGHLVEEADTEELFQNYQHPYTEALLSAAAPPDPTIRKKPIVLKGEVPSPLNVPKGCVFASRCPHCRQICQAERPKFLPIPGHPGHSAACHFPLGRNRKTGGDADR